LQCEVGAAASGTWLGNDDMRHAPFIMVRCSTEGLHPPGRSGVCDWKSELLLFELGNDDQPQPRALNPSLGGSFF